MKILAVDTSSKSGSIALMEGSDVLDELTVPDVGTHSTWLLGAVSELMERASASNGTTINDVDRFAIAGGPGSFTGLRIGVSTVQGLAWSLGREVSLLSTLEAMAMNVPFTVAGGDAGEDFILPLIDGRRGKIYGALYRRSCNGRGPDGEVLDRIVEDGPFSPETLLEEVKGAIGEIQGDGVGEGSIKEVNIYLLGDGLNCYGDSLKRGLQSLDLASRLTPLILDEGYSVIRASNLGIMACHGRGEVVRAGDLRPLYHRQTAAEENLSS